MPAYALGLTIDPENPTRGRTVTVTVERPAGYQPSLLPASTVQLIPSSPLHWDGPTSIVIAAGQTAASVSFRSDQPARPTFTVQARQTYWLHGIEVVDESPPINFTPGDPALGATLSLVGSTPSTHGPSYSMLDDATLLITVSRSTLLSTPLTLQLSSSFGKFTVPATVTMPANQSTIQIPVTGRFAGEDFLHVLGANGEYLRAAIVLAIAPTRVYPTPTSSTINSAGNTLTVTFNTPTKILAAPTLNRRFRSMTLGNSSVTGFATSHTFPISTLVDTIETPTVTFGSESLQSDSDRKNQSITATVTNNSTIITATPQLVSAIAFREGVLRLFFDGSVYTQQQSQHDWPGVAITLYSPPSEAPTMTLDFYPPVHVPLTLNPQLNGSEVRFFRRDVESFYQGESFLFALPAGDHRFFSYAGRPVSISPLAMTAFSNRFYTKPIPARLRSAGRDPQPRISRSDGLRLTTASSSLAPTQQQQIAAADRVVLRSTESIEHRRIFYYATPIVLAEASRASITSSIDTPSPLVIAIRDAIDQTSIDASGVSIVVQSASIDPDPDFVFVLPSFAMFRVPESAGVFRQSVSSDPAAAIQFESVHSPASFRIARDDGLGLIVHADHTIETTNATASAVPLIVESPFVRDYEVVDVGSVLIDYGHPGPTVIQVRQPITPIDRVVFGDATVTRVSPQIASAVPFQFDSVPAFRVALQPDTPPAVLFASAGEVTRTRHDITDGLGMVLEATEDWSQQQRDVIGDDRITVADDGYIQFQWSESTAVSLMLHSDTSEITSRHGVDAGTPVIIGDQSIVRSDMEVSASWSTDDAITVSTNIRGPIPGEIGSSLFHGATGPIAFRQRHQTPQPIVLQDAASTQVTAVIADTDSVVLSHSLDDHFIRITSTDPASLTITESSSMSTTITTDVSVETILATRGLLAQRSPFEIRFKTAPGHYVYRSPLLIQVSGGFVAPTINVAAQYPDGEVVPNFVRAIDRSKGTLKLLLQPWYRPDDPLYPIQCLVTQSESV